MSTNDIQMQEILQTLPMLDGKGLQTVRRAIDGLLAHQAMATDTDTDKKDRWETLVYSTVAKTLADLKIGCPPLSRFYKIVPRTQVMESVAGVRDYINGVWPTATRVEQQLILQTLVTMVITHLQQQEVPIGPKTVLQQLTRAPTYFTRAFPGYVEVGLAGFVLKAIKAKSSLEG